MSNFIVDPFNAQQAIDLVQGGEPLLLEEHEISILQLPRGGEQATTYETVINSHVLHLTLLCPDADTLDDINASQSYRRRMIVRYDGRTAIRQSGGGSVAPGVVAVEKSEGSGTFVTVQSRLYQEDED